MKIFNFINYLITHSITKILASAALIAAITNPKYLTNDLTINGAARFLGVLFFYASLFLIFYQKRSRIILFIFLLMVSSISFFSWIYDIKNLDALTIHTIFSHAKTLSNYYIDLTNSAILICIAIILYAAIRIPKQERCGNRVYITALFFSFFWIMSERDAVPGVFFSKGEYLWQILSRNINPEDLTSKNKFEVIEPPDYIVLLRTDSIRADYWNKIFQDKESFFTSEKIENLTSFPNVYSFRANTNTSLGYIFTRFQGLDDANAFREKSFIHIFKHLGFDTTYLNINDQEIGTPTTNPAALFALESNYIWNNKNTPRIEGNYQNIITGSGQRGIDSLPHVQFHKLLNDGRLKKPSLIIISHCCDGHIAWDYFPEHEQFTRYKPYCIPVSGKFSHCSNTEIINAYKNSILYTDYLTATMLKALENSKSIVIATSDHGQALGELGQYGHGLTATQSLTENQKNSFLFNVATFVWASPKYINENKEKWNAIRENSVKNYDHSFVFHSMLSCAGINSTLIDSQKNICTK